LRKEGKKERTTSVVTRPKRKSKGKRFSDKKQTGRQLERVFRRGTTLSFRGGGRDPALGLEIEKKVWSRFGAEEKKKRILGKG